MTPLTNVWSIRHLSLSTPEVFRFVSYRISFNMIVAIAEKWTMCFGRSSVPFENKMLHTTLWTCQLTVCQDFVVFVTTWKPLRLVPSPTTPGRECRTVTCDFSYWCLHLNSDIPRTQSDYYPSAVALGVVTVVTLFSCQDFRPASIQEMLISIQPF